MLKILHTSDLQLGAPFQFLGENGRVYRQQLTKTFRNIADLARNGKYDILLVAGDLFNNNQPSARLVDEVTEILASAKTPICILPGNHDCYDNVSIYRTMNFPSNVHVLDGSPSYIDFPDLDLTVAGNAIRSRQGRTSSLKGIERKVKFRSFVVMAHGNLKIPGVVESEERPIERREIKECDADYVALGDWHAFRDCSQGKVKAFYSGSPEPTAVDQSGAGFVASVSLSDRGADVQKVPVGSMQAERLELDVTGLSAKEVLAKIKSKANEKLMLDVTLQGLTSLASRLDPKELQEEASENFFWLRVNDASHIELGKLDPDDFPEAHAIGQYVHMMSDKISACRNEKERKIAEQALQLGVALLKGEQVLT